MLLYVCVHVYVYIHIYVWILEEARRGCRIPWSWSNRPLWCWELNSGPELSLYTQHELFKKNWVLWNTARCQGTKAEPSPLWSVSPWEIDLGAERPWKVPAATPERLFEWQNASRMVIPGHWVRCLEADVSSVAWHPDIEKSTSVSWVPSIPCAPSTVCLECLRGRPVTRGKLENGAQPRMTALVPED